MELVVPAFCSVQSMDTVYRLADFMLQRRRTYDCLEGEISNLSSQDYHRVTASLLVI